MSNLFFYKLIKNKDKYRKNILYLSNKNNYFNKNDDVLSYKNEVLPAQIEWFNSIYSYNKNYVRSISPYNKIINEVIKSFFNLHYVKNLKKEKRRWRTKRIKSIRWSINRILLSKAEILTTNKKAFFNIYIYNAEKRYLINKLKKINMLSKSKLRKSLFRKKIYKIKKKASKIFILTKKIFFFLEKTKYNYKNNIWNNKKPIYKYTILKNFIKKSLIKERLNIKYKYSILANKSKFENTYLYPLHKLISKLIDKKIEFNIINLKYLHLNSNILSHFIAIKVKNKKNRVLKVLYKFFNKLNMPILAIKTKFLFRDKKYWLSKLPEQLTSIKYKYLYTFFSIDKKKNNKNDILNLLIQKKIKLKFERKRFLVKKILKTIKNKWIYGVRLHLTGRLTRRFIAARSISKKRYKGCLRNVNSSYKGFPSVMLRGHTRSNIQYSKRSSLRRIGSFGVKGWISNQ